MGELRIVYPGVAGSSPVATAKEASLGKAFELSPVLDHLFPLFPDRTETGRRDGDAWKSGERAPQTGVKHQRLSACESRTPSVRLRLGFYHPSAWRRFQNANAADCRVVL